MCQFLQIHFPPNLIPIWCFFLQQGGVPSEDRMDIERFMDSDITQGEIERNLGGDALHMALGHVTNIWLPRLPVKVLALITSFLDLQEIANLHKVSLYF